MELEDIEKKIVVINTRLQIHSKSLGTLNTISGNIDKLLVKQIKLTDFLAEQLVDIAKKVNESLMIANDYERKQIRMTKQIKDFLENFEGLK